MLQKQSAESEIRFELFKDAELTTNITNHFV